MDAEYFYSNVGVGEFVPGNGAEYVYSNIGVGLGGPNDGAEYTYMKVVVALDSQAGGFVVCDIWSGDGSKSPMILG